MAPAAVRSAVASALATPKSAILATPAGVMRGALADIGGLDIAVHDLLLVRVVEGVCDLGKHVDGFRCAKRFFRSQSLSKRFPFDELHDDVARILQGNDVVYGNDSGVLELRRDLRLSQEARPELVRVVAVGELVHPDPLDGDNPVEQGVVGFVNLTEGALAEALTHFVAAVEGFGHVGGDFLRARAMGSHAMSLRKLILFMQCVCLRREPSATLFCRAI